MTFKLVLNKDPLIEMYRTPHIAVCSAPGMAGHAIQVRVKADADMVVCDCEGMDRQAYLRPLVAAFVSSVVCNDKCINAIGPSCACSCGGKNHATQGRA